jgi:uncharacterized membrane protein YfcA
MHPAASVPALFILCNSIAAVAGNWSATKHLPHGIGRLALMVVVGSSLGAHLGSRWLSPRQIHVLLNVVLIIASLKLLLPVCVTQAARRKRLGSPRPDREVYSTTRVDSRTTAFARL